MLKWKRGIAGPGKFAMADGTTVSYIDPVGFAISYNEIFVDQTYYFETENKNPLIVDLGGNIGASTLFFKRAYPGSRVMVFEPRKNESGCIRENIAQNGLAGVSVFQSAVFDKETEMEIYDDKRGITLGASLITNPFAGEHVEKVRCVRLSKLIKERVDLLKVDIEGSEGRVLKEIRGKLGLIDKVIMEYHPYETEKNSLPEILELLTEEGFKHRFGTSPWGEYRGKTDASVFNIYFSKE